MNLGQSIAANLNNLIASPGGRQVFEQEVNIGQAVIKVRVVLNPLGNLRSVHIKRE